MRMAAGGETNLPLVYVQSAEWHGMLQRCRAYDQQGTATLKLWGFEGGRRGKEGLMSQHNTMP